MTDQKRKLKTFETAVLRKIGKWNNPNFRWRRISMKYYRHAV